MLIQYLAPDRPHLDYDVQFWYPDYRQAVCVLGSAQRGLIKSDSRMFGLKGILEIMLEFKRTHTYTHKKKGIYIFQREGSSSRAETKTKPFLSRKKTR